MRIVVVAVGRLKLGPERALAESYGKRFRTVGRSLGLRELELVEIRESRAADLERRRLEEAVAVANVIPEGAPAIVLDEHGESLNSAGLAELLRQHRAQERPAICFVIGGPDGVAASLREQAALSLSFGAATWPHQLVRIMLLEQLYRAATILAGHPYHRA